MLIHWQTFIWHDQLINQINRLTGSLFTYCDIWFFYVVKVRREKNLIDLMEDPINAHVVAVRHVRLIDEDAALKTSNNQSININNQQQLKVKHKHL